MLEKMVDDVVSFYCTEFAMQFAAQHYLLYVLYGLIYFCLLNLMWAEKKWVVF